MNTFEKFNYCIETVKRSNLNLNKVSYSWNSDTDIKFNRILKMLSKYDDNESALEKFFDGDSKYISYFIDIVKLYTAAIVPSEKEIESFEFKFKNKFNNIQNHQYNTIYEICLPELYGIVLIKPNLVSYEDYPETTDIELLHVILEKIKDYDINKLIVADGPSIFHEQNKPFMRLKNLQKNYKFELVNANLEPTIRIKYDNMYKDIPIFIKNVDFLLNVAQFKEHNSAIYTGAIKNIFGLLPDYEKLKIHKKGVEDFYKEIASVYTILEPSLTILDGRKIMKKAQQKEHGGYIIDDGFGILVGDGIIVDKEAIKILNEKKLIDFYPEETYLKYL